ncbi:MAG: hypothetical protein ACK4IB_07740 [Erythrobacter sp.]|jgi:mono/diheme cytochrome c family protein
MIRTALLSAAALFVSGCQTSMPQSTATKPPAFVEAACGGCHAVEPPFLSPNPESPSFAAIANREGLTEATLGDWLVDAHNYPEQMDFDLTREQAEQIADYMITLRRADYVPEQ